MAAQRRAHGRRQSDDSAHVDTVFIAGRVKKWRGNLVGVDVARVLRLVEESRDGLVRRTGFQMNMLG